jgi:hypothetical protein
LRQAGLRELQVSPGVIYRKVVQKKPQRTYYVLTVDPSSAATLDNVVAGTKYPALDLTSKMVIKDGGEAGINGDFGLQPGRPAHMSAADGELLQTSVLGKNGRAFGISQDETASYFGTPKVSIRLADPALPSPIAIDTWNVGTPQGDEVSAYSPRGGTMAPTPTGACSARLLATSSAGWSPSGRISTEYQVDAVRCGDTAMSLDGGIVVATRESGASASLVSAIGVGDDVSVSWSSGWPGVTDVLGGGEVLIRDGQIAVSKCDTYLCMRNPRTSVGVTSDGKILMVVVDGRPLRAGATLIQLATLMKGLGAVNAMNLDGSGSSTMVVNGKVVNVPSDGHERAVTSALVVLPGPDPNDIPPAP